MNVFEEVKEKCTAREVAEHYGLRINPHGMACCPFHNDHHPSMKIDHFYYCFACGAKGDAINYVSQMFGIGQYEAACKIIEDMHLPVPVKRGKSNHRNQMEYQKMLRQKKLKISYQERFQKWCVNTVDLLKSLCAEITELKVHYEKLLGMEAMDNDFFCELILMETHVTNWLDVLCTGTAEEKMKLFISERKEVDSYRERIITIRRKTYE